MVSHDRFACMCCGFAFVLRVNLSGLCLLIFFSSSLLLISPRYLFYWSSFELFFYPGSCGPLLFVALQNFPWIWGFCFLHVGIAFLCVLGSPVLVFINEVFFLFKLLGRLLRPIAPSIIMSSFGLWCLWWLSSLSFMRWRLCFVARSWIPLGSRFYCEWRCSCVSSRRLGLVHN